MKHLIATSAFALLLATGASAQTAVPAPVAPAAPGTSQTAPPNTAPGMSTGTVPRQPGTAAGTNLPGQPISSTLLGTQVWKQAVYDSSGARIGEIDDMVVSATGQINEALIGVGGFLGMGEKTVAVPFSSLKPMADGSRVWFVLNQTKDQLSSAPAFDYKAYKR